MAKLEERQAEAATPRPVRAWHPYIWACYPVLWLYAQNAGEAWFGELLWPVAIALALTALLGWTLRREMPSPSRRAVFLSAFMVAVLGYGHIEEALRRQLIGWDLAPSIEHLRIVLSLSLLVALLLLVRRLRARGDLPAATRFMNVAATVALVLASAQALPGRSVAAEIPVPKQPFEPRAGDAEHPDIFLIMLDAYAGADQLLENYGIDNEPFLSGLEKRGFYVAREAHGNYQWTVLSVTSLLNMRYILEPEHGPRLVPIAWSGREQSVRPYFLTNRVCAELKVRGYTTVSFETPQSVIQLRSADRYLTPGSALSELQRTALDATWPMALLQQANVPVERYLNDSHRRRRVHYIFDSLKQLGGEKQPVFVMAHVMNPHVPFIFRRDGSPNHNPRGDGYRKGYGDQLLYMNTLVLGAIDDIQARLPEAVIVVQSDHGGRMPGRQSGDRAAYAREFLSSLNAVYVPGGAGYETLSPGFSQVNTFRYLFNTLFGLGLPYLPDVSYLESVEVDDVYVPVEWNGYEPVFLDAAAEAPERALLDG